MKIIFMYFCYLFIAGCSIQSYQYDMAKELLVSKKNTQEIPSPNWEVNWKGIKKKVYAINSNDNVFFTDGEIIIHFDGWNIVSAKGLNYDDREILIKNNHNNITYSVEGEFINKVACDDWEKVTLMNNSGFERRCSKLPYSFKDLIILNNENKLVSLEFVLIPGQSAIKINLRH